MLTHVESDKLAKSTCMCGQFRVELTYVVLIHMRCEELDECDHNLDIV